MLKRHKKIIEFIKLIRESSNIQTDIFTNGSCYRFYEILTNVFFDGIPYYNQEHVITRIGSRYYDITGEVKNIKDYRPLNYVPKRGKMCKVSG